MNPRMMATALIVAGLGLAPVDAAALRSQDGPYELEVLSNGAQSRTFSHAGESYVLGQNGDRYTLRVWNRSSRRVEVVATVDGRDVVDGKPGDLGKRGYVVAPYGHVDIEGWRLSSGQVAAFRFSSVARSYAARTGSAREVGVVGVAVFPERAPPRPIYIPRPYPRPYQPMPYDDYSGDRDGYSGRAEQAPGKSGPASEPSASAPPPADKRMGSGEESGKSRADGAYVERERRNNRPGLGTAFGEAVNSSVYETEFVRQSSRPSAVLGMRYNDRGGLIAMGVNVDGSRYAEEPYLRRSAEPFPVSDRRYAPPPPAWEY